MATFPNTLIPSSIVIGSITQSYVSVSQNMNSERRTTGAQRWTIGLDFIALSREKAQILLAFLASQKGSFGTFDFILPYPLNIPIGVPGAGPFTLLPDSNSKGSSFHVNGFYVSTLGALKAGDFIKFSNHDKVYMLAEDVNTDVLGYGTMLLTSPVLEPITPALTTIVTDNVVFKMSLQDTTLSTGVSNEVFYSFSGIQLIESYSTTPTV